MLKKLLTTIILVAVVAGLGFLAYNAILNRDININQWFIGGMTKGVDISSYQEDVDMQKLMEQGIGFVYIKSTEGSSHVDSSFKEKWKAAEQTGLMAGAYHYFSYNNSGVEQAENFIETVGDLSGRLIPAIDMELTPEEVMDPPEKDDVVRGLKAFLGIVEEKYKVKPLIYARQDYYEKYLADDFSDYPRWVRNVYWPVYVNAGEDWLVWQYHDKAVLGGYSGEKYIDLNVVNSKLGLDALKMPENK